MVQKASVLYVSYEGRQIEVDIRDADLYEEFRYIFDRMLVERPVQVSGSLTVIRGEDGFAIAGAKHMDETAVNLRSALQQLKFEVIHQCIEHATDQLWLHAGAVSCDGKGVLLCGTWGKGKSTLASELCTIGWQYLSDDIVPLGIASHELHPFQLTPMKRVHATEDRDKVYTPHEVSQLSKTRVALDEGAYAKGTAELAGVFFPDYAPDAAMQLAPCGPADATMILLENCLNLKSLKQKAIQCIAGVVETVPVYRLPYTEGAEAAQLIVDRIMSGGTIAE